MAASDDENWVKIQKQTFTRWCNTHLQKRSMAIDDLQSDLATGVNLINLLEQISNKIVAARYTKAPKIKSQMLENVQYCLTFLDKEGIKLVNIGAPDLVDKKLKLILGLIWTLILRYQIQNGGPGGKSAKVTLVDWMKTMLPDFNGGNLCKAVNDGIAICRLCDQIKPGSFPNHASLDPANALENAIAGTDCAERELGIPKVLSPEDMVSPHVDELSVMTYLSYFVAADKEINGDGDPAAAAEAERLRKEQEAERLRQEQEAAAAKARADAEAKAAAEAVAAAAAADRARAEAEAQAAAEAAAEAERERRRRSEQEAEEARMRAEEQRRQAEAFRRLAEQNRLQEEARLEALRRAQEQAAEDDRQRLAARRAAELEEEAEQERLRIAALEDTKREREQAERDRAEAERRAAQAAEEAARLAAQVAAEAAAAEEERRRWAEEDAERARLAALAAEADARRKAAAEAERQRQAAELAERQRRAVEEADRLRKQMEAKRAALEAERQRRAQEDAERQERERAEEEGRRREDEERARLALMRQDDYCVRCAEIVEEGVTADEKAYHFECFFCQECNVNLRGKGFVIGPEHSWPICEHCYTDRFFPKCGGCDKAIKDTHFQINNKPYHKNCCKCYKCDVALKDGFFRAGDKVSCKQHRIPSKAPLS